MGSIFNLKSRIFLCLIGFLSALTIPAFAQESAPQFSALLMTNYAGTVQRFNANPYRGKRALIMFWASDCPPCLVEMRGFNALKREVKMPIIIVTENWDRREQALLAGPKAMGAIIVQPQGNFVRLLGYFGDTENSLPYSILTDETGSACIAHLGVLSAQNLREMQSECSKG